MVSSHTIKTVAKYEMRILWRSWFFRIFAGLAVIGIGIFNVAVFVESSGAPWMYRTLPAAIPYANLMVLNLGQAIVAVFLASEFLKQDRKNDTVEVIYARSMTNLEYVLGKTLGVLAVFFILNVVVLVFGLGFSFLSHDSSRGILEAFLYPLLISLPTLVFILGLSYSFMILFKNQAITFILILGYIALTIFYLNNRFYHLLDYIAYHVPMFLSTISGFGNLTEILIHRGIYLFLGIGLIFLTVFKLQRLPQSKRLTSFPLYIAFVFLFAGGYLIKMYLDIKMGAENYRKQLISINNQYVSNPKVYVDSCFLDVDYENKELIIQSELFVTNNSGEDIDTLLFSLNPSLNIEKININGTQTDFQRNLHLIKIPRQQKLLSGEKARVEMQYRGGIDERTHSLDQDFEKYEDNFNLEIFRVRKRYAFLEDDFVCLTSESLWYPISGVTYATIKPAMYLPDFTKFRLQVHTNDSLMAVSQGELSQPDPDTYVFQPECNLPKISLLIGDYEKRSIKVDSIDYSLYTIKGHDYYLEHFTDITDSLPKIIRELKNEYETLLDLDYPFKRLALAEVPLHFAMDKHLWSLASDAVQPEIVFYPEKGAILEETDFKRRIKRFEKRMERDNEEVTPEELQTRMFKRWARGNYMAPPTEWYLYDNVMDRNTYSFFPNYYTFKTQFNSTDWPILNLAMEIYMKERNESSVQSYRWFWRGISKGERINLELKQSTLIDLMLSGVEEVPELEDREQLSINDIILAKGEYLFSLFRARYGEEEFNKFLNEIIAKHKYQSFTFDDFDNWVQQTFDQSIENEVDSWYSKVLLPGFLMKDLQTYKVVEDEHTKYQLRFKLSNPEAIDGIVTVNIELDDPNRQRNYWSSSTPDFSKKVHIPAGTAKEVSMVFNTEPARMNVYTHISENLPNNIIIDFSSFDETKRTAALDTVYHCAFFQKLTSPNETIVDNEDEGFSFVQVTNESYLKALINKNKKQRYKYSGIYFWNPPAVWKSVLRSGFYGKYVRSAMYTRTGEGDRKAVWDAEIEKSAYFDIYYHLEKVEIEWGRRSSRKPNYNFKVYHEEGVEEITLSDQELENGWNYLGTFYVTPETAKVEMTNKSIGDMVFADAVKWVKLR